jgi:hypothetical protein
MGSLVILDGPFRRWPCFESICVGLLRGRSPRCFLFFLVQSLKSAGPGPLLRPSSRRFSTVRSKPVVLTLTLAQSFSFPLASQLLSFPLAQSPLLHRRCWLADLGPPPPFLFFTWSSTGVWGWGRSSCRSLARRRRRLLLYLHCRLRRRAYVDLALV